MKKQKRIFIVGPADYDSEDNLYQICSTTNHRDSILTIYQMDDYDDFDATDMITDAMRLAKKAAKKVGFKGRIITI